MLSSVSLGQGLKTRPTPPNGAAAAPTPSSPKQDARTCVTPDPSAAVEALEASLEACLKSAAALGGAAPTGAAARLASKAERLSKTIAALGETTCKAAPETSDDEAVDAGPRAAPGPSYWDHAREWHSCVNLGDSERARTSRRSSWRTLFNRRVLLGLVSGHEDPDDPRATGASYACMLSPQSSFRLGWDIFIAVVLAYVAIVEPLAPVSKLALGFRGFRHLTRQGLPLGIINRIVDVIFICDLLLNFRTGYIDDRNQLVLEPRKSAYHYLTTWFPLDFVSSTPPIIELIVYLAASGAGDESSTSIIKVLRVLKIVKIVRIAKLVKLTDPNSALADAMEDLFLTSHWAAATSDAVWYISFDRPRGRRDVGFPRRRVLFLLVLAFFCAHLLACSMAATGDGWYESYPSDDVDASDWYWGRQYLVALYWAFTTMTTVGYGDVTPQTDEERIFCIFAMIIGVAFYSYIIATVASMVTSTDAKQAIYRERMEQLRSWMRHYRFGLALRRRTRRFFKEYYASHSAIDDNAILADLAPDLQRDVADYLLRAHASIKHHPLFAALPEDSLWKVLAIVRTESLDAGAVVVGRGRPSSTLYIVRAGRVETSYEGGQRLVGAGASFAVWKSTRGSSNVDPSHPTRSFTVLRLRSFGELCVLGLSTVSLVDATCVTQSDFFFIRRDRFLNAFSNLPEVLAEMAAREDVYRRRPVRVPKASLGSI